MKHRKKRRWRIKKEQSLDLSPAFCQPRGKRESQSRASQAFLSLLFLEMSSQLPGLWGCLGSEWEKHIIVLFWWEPSSKRAEGNMLLGGLSPWSPKSGGKQWVCVDGGHPACRRCAEERERPGELKNPCKDQEASAGLEKETRQSCRGKERKGKRGLKGDLTCMQSCRSQLGLWILFCQERSENTPIHIPKGCKLA